MNILTLATLEQIFSVLRIVAGISFVANFAISLWMNRYITKTDKDSLITMRGLNKHRAWISIVCLLASVLAVVTNLILISMVPVFTSTNLGSVFLWTGLSMVYFYIVYKIMQIHKVLDARIDIKARIENL